MTMMVRGEWIAVAAGQGREFMPLMAGGKWYAGP